MLMTKNCKDIFFFFKNINLLIPRPLKWNSTLQKKPSALKREHLAPQTMKFKFLWVLFALLDTDSVSTDSSVVDPDPDQYDP
jgi:hypothetical protein